MDMIAKIKKEYHGLTWKQKLIADYMLENIEKLSFQTLKELSEELGITETTILNACRALGFASFSEVKYESRKYISLMEKVKLHLERENPLEHIPEYELKDQKKIVKNIIREEMEAMAMFADSINIDTLFTAAELFLSSSEIILCGRGVSRILADFLAVRLAGVEISTSMMDTELTDSIHISLPALKQGTLAVIISFPDYYFMTDKIAEHAAKEGCKVILITDSKKAPAAPFADLILTAPSNTRLFLNTISSPVALINVLTSTVDILNGYRKDGDVGGSAERFSNLFRNQGYHLESEF